MAEAKLTPQQFVEKLNKELGSGAASMGGTIGQTLNVKRFSSGVLSLDLALGGGWPFGRISVIAGEYSTGKSELALQACASITKYDHATKEHQYTFTEAQLPKFSPGRAMYVDTEGAFDPDWAALKGFDVNHHIIVRPESAEQAIDAISLAIEQNVVDLIILDSIAQMTPMKEITESSEDWQMGLAARMNNKACRKWLSLMMMRGRIPGGAPALIMLNQFRLKIGLVFGDPRTLPGGKGQEFVSSIIAYTRSGKLAEGEAHVELGGTVYKNKTFNPKKVYSFNLGLADEAKMGRGKIDNFTPVVDLLKSAGWLTGSGKNMVLFSTPVGDIDQVRQYLIKNDTIRYKAWRSLNAHLCKYRGS